MTTTDGERARLLPTAELMDALRARDESYDPAWQALRLPLRAQQYHTRLRGDILVHPTMTSADYALGLLDSGEQWRVDRATVMLWRLVEAQDTDSAHDTYGIWSWFYDEPLDQMATPDWNWADFIGVRLVEILARHAEPLHVVDARLVEALRSALGHACRAIIRRDVALSYTNIAIMGTYVTVAGGRLLDDAEIVGYGRDRLRRLAAFTEDYGGFPEYNSPAYTCVVLVELTRMLRDFGDDDRRPVQSLHDRAWREVATHWHRPSGQWAGPHSRSYSTLLGDGRDEEFAVLQRGLGERFRICERPLAPSLTLWSVPLRCPDELAGLFTDDAPRRDAVAEVSQGTAPAIAMTRLRPGYALGVVSHGIFWEQSRPLVAYAQAETGPVAWRVRFLYDGRDLAAGRIFTRLVGDTVLAGVCCASDVGAAHADLDHDFVGRLRAGDVRLRFELVGDSSLELPHAVEMGDTVHVRLGTTARLALRVVDAAFGDHPARITTTSTETGSALDVVLYEGAERMFDLTGEFPVYALFAASVVEQSSTPDDLSLVHGRTGHDTAEIAIGSDAPAAIVRIPTRARPAAALAGITGG